MSASLHDGTPVVLCAVQASTVGAAFLTKTIPELNVKFEIWCDGGEHCVRSALARKPHMRRRVRRARDAVAGPRPV